MYVSIRTYRFKKGSIDELMHRVDRDLADAFVQETGFVAYQVAHTGEHTVASITVFTSATRPSGPTSWPRTGWRNRWPSSTSSAWA
jgi:hypothetical protein